MTDPRLILSLAGCALFGAILLAEFSGAADERNPIAAPPARTAVATPAAQRPVPAVHTDDLLATGLARPLFSPTRRPPEAAPGDEGAVGDLAGKRLSGIVIAADRRVAIFAVAGGKPLAVSEGESVSGWRLDRIAPNEISLSGPGGSRTLQPKADPNAVRERAPFPTKRGAPAPPVPPGPQAAAPRAGAPAVAPVAPRPLVRPPIAPPLRGRPGAQR